MRGNIYESCRLQEDETIEILKYCYQYRKTTIMKRVLGEDHHEISPTGDVISIFCFTIEI